MGVKAWFRREREWEIGDCKYRQTAFAGSFSLKKRNVVEIGGKGIKRDFCFCVMFLMGTYGVYEVQWGCFCTVCNDQSGH